MPLYATHLLVGLLCSLPFYYLDKKDRLRTIVAGMFAAVLPDIDGVLQYIPHPEEVHVLFVHRGFWHWWSLWLLFIFAWMSYLIWLSNGDTIRDNFITFSAVSLAWATHLILDFGFTSYYNEVATIFEIDWNYWTAFDQVAALILSTILAYLLHLRSQHEDTLV